MAATRASWGAHKGGRGATPPLFSPMAPSQQPQRKHFAAASSLEVFHAGGPVRLSPDGTQLATCVHETISIVDVATSKVKFTLGGGGGGGGGSLDGGGGDDTEPITALCWGKDGRRVFSASRSMRCTVWDATTGESIRSFKAHGMPVLHMTVDPSGTLLCTSSADRTARVWDVAKGFCTHAFRGHAAMVTVAAFHPDARRLELYTGADDGEVRAWSLKDRACVGTMHEHQSAVTALAVPMSAEGGSDRLLSAARDRVVHEWDLRTKTRVATVPVHEAAEGLVALDPAAAVHLIGRKHVLAKPRGVYFATAGEKGTVRVWRVGSAKPLSEGASLSGSGDGDEGVGDDAAAGTFMSLHATPGGDGLLAVTGDSRLLFYGSGKSHGASDADSDAGGGVGSLVIERELIGNTDEIISAAFLPMPEIEAGGGAGAAAGAGAGSGEKTSSARPSALAVATNSALLRVFDPSTMACTAALSGHSGAILSLDAATGPKGEALVMTGSRDHTVRLWDLTPAAAAVAAGRAGRGGAATTAGARCIAVGMGHVGAVAAVALAKRNGAPLAISGGADKVARVWDIAAALRAFAAASLEAFAAAGVDPDDDDDVTHAVVVAPVPLLAKSAAIAHDKAVNCVAVAPNLAVGATCSGDRTARLWRLPDLIPAGVLRGHKRGVWAVAFSPTDRIVATAGGDKMIKLWSCDPNGGGGGNACLRTLEGHTAAVLALRFISGGTQIVSTGGDGLMVLWGVRAGAAIATLDAHEDKAWALASDADGDRLATGGADAKLTLWEDATTAAAQEEAAGLAAQAGAQQALSNAAASGQHEKAARLALKLNHTHALLKAVKAMLADPGGGGDAALDALAGTVTGKALHRFLGAIREWNANARHCDAAQRCLAALLRLRSLRELAAVPGARDSAAALRAYTQRHFARAGRLLRGTYLLDVALAGMGVLLDDEEDEGNGGVTNPGGAEAATSEEDAALASGGAGGLLAEMVAGWGAGAPSAAEVVAAGTMGGGGKLGVRAQAAARAPLLTVQHVGGDDEDDFDLGDFSDDDGASEDGEKGEDGAVKGEEDEMGTDEDDKAEESDEEEEAEMQEEEQEGSDEEEGSEAESEEPEPEPKPRSHKKGGNKSSTAAEPAPALKPVATKPPLAPASARKQSAAAAAAAASAADAISPRKTRTQRRAESLESSPAPSPASSPPPAVKVVKTKTPAKKAATSSPSKPKSAVKRKVTVEEPAEEPGARRSVRARN